MVNYDEPTSLWIFAKRRFPLRCNAYLAWWDVRGTTVSENIRERVERQLDTISWPRAEEWKSCLKAIRLQDEKASSLRRNAQHLIGTDLPHKVRQELLTDLVAGRCILTGRRHQDGERENITIDDLAGMEVDLGKSMLVGPTSCFFNVVVTERAAGDVATDGSAEPPIDVPPLAATAVSPEPSHDEAADKKPNSAKGQGRPRFSEAEVRGWYLQRIGQHVKDGVRPSQRAARRLAKNASGGKCLGTSSEGYAVSWRPASGT